MIQKNTSGLYEALKTDILMGHHAPGSKLKIEMLKERYGMGVNVIRESLARLATEDLVDSEDQKGFRVAQTSSARLSDLTRMRVLLETDGVKHSIQNGGIDWESNLVAAHQKLAYVEEKMRLDEEAHCKIWHQCDWEFHAALIADCGSQLHSIYHQRVFDQFRQYVMVDLKTNGFRGNDIIEEHQLIVDAALARDYERCAKALEDHLSFYHFHKPNS
ncbi:GntR family transcriptional regulator [Desulfosediminicola flagellatus]|uniref:GntR family transcriptional regulator n=1 Tax=Desulfosediminicola flagellatus TaxID=2569541 RepID=UPI0010AC2269|nr:FCD domain-containing protein [Desulfosediminicola flagellatus]